MPPKGAPAAPAPPPGFEVRRDSPPGRHPLLQVFPGLDRLPIAARLVPDPVERERFFLAALVEVVPEDVWMYVAPRSQPRGRRPGWHPRVSPDADCVVVGQSHLQNSPAFTLYLDIFHELRHTRQRAEGAELFDRSVSYVRRPTELDAYRFVLEDARRLGASDAYLRDYLRVEWISDEEYAELLARLGVADDERARSSASL